MRGELRDWYRVGKMVRGYVIGDHWGYHPNHAFIATALIIKVGGWVDEGDYILCKTQMGHWKLFKNCRNLAKDNEIL